MKILGKIKVVKKLVVIINNASCSNSGTVYVGSSCGHDTVYITCTARCNENSWQNQSYQKTDCDNN